MKNRIWTLCLLVVCILVLAACGGAKDKVDADAKKSEDETPKNEKSEKNEKELSYSLVEDITSEDGFLPFVIIDDAGETVLFFEESEAVYSTAVYVDGEIKDLDEEWFDLSSTLTSQGKVTGNQYDGFVYSYMLYDPYTDEEKIYTTEQDLIQISNKTDFLEDENGNFKEVLRSVSEPDKYEIDIVNLEEDTYETIDFTEILLEYVTSDDYHDPDVFYSNDGDKIFTLTKEATSSDGSSSTIIHSYHIENEEFEVVAELDEQFYLANSQNSAFSSDGESLFLISTGEPALHKLDVGSGEIENLGEDFSFQSMNDNNYASFAKDTGEITITNIDSGESKVAYTVEDIDNISLKNYSISPNGKTIAYIYQDHGDDEESHHLKILHAD